MSPNGHFSREELAIVVISLANIGLLIAAVFRNADGSREQTDSMTRVNLGYVAVSLGLCSQILYCLMLAVWRYGWIPLDPGVNSLTHLEAKLSNVGGLLSTAAVLAALFGKGLRRYAGIWVGVATFCFWSITGLGAALSSLFR